MANDDTDSCCVAGCKNKQLNSNLCFFTFPKEVDRQNLWLRVIGRSDLISKMDMRDSNYRVCAKHFHKTAKSEVIVRRLLPDAVPTKYLPTSPRTNVLHYERDEHGSDVSTQTDVTYGYDPKAEADVFVEVDGKQVLLKKEKDPEIPKLNTFVLEKPFQKETIVGINSAQSTSNKTKNQDI